MLVWKDTAVDDHVFSVVAADGRTLDCQASDDNSRDIWCDGITKMLGMSEEDRLAAEAAYDPNAAAPTVEKVREKTASQLATQRNLFNMIVKTTFREINYEGLYGFLGDPVQAEFKDDKFYQTALAQNVPWRDWEVWVRAQICTYLVSNGLVVQDVVTAQEEKVAAARASGAAPVAAEPRDDCLIA